MSGRIYITENFSENSEVYLSQEQYRDELKHLTKVLRKKAGDHCKLTNGKGVEAEAEILEIDKNGLRVKVLCVQQIALDKVRLLLWQAILKPPRMDWLMEKSAELGVSCIQPLLTEFVVGNDHPEDAAKRMGRWQRLLMAGLKQSGAAYIPALAMPAHLSDLQNSVPAHSLSLVLSFSPQAKSPGKIFQKIKGEKLQNVILAIGPEGGFSDREENSLISCGFLPTSLGRSTLRGETAAIAACAVAREYIDFFLQNDITTA